MSDFQKILVIICLNIATIAYVILFKHRVKKGFKLLTSPFKEMDKARLEASNPLVGTFIATTNFIVFWMAVKLSIYSAFLNVYTVYRWINGQSLFGP